MNTINFKVDFYSSKAKMWKEELEQLRTIVLDRRPTEELKPGVPRYTLQDNNILLIHAFNDYCAPPSFKGALLNDADGLPIRQTENSRAGRRLRFTGVGEIAEMESVIQARIHETLEVEKSGLKVKYKKTVEFRSPPCTKRMIFYL